MNISYEAYRVFYYTAKTRSFTQAANALRNSQPNITRIIKNLERELGCTLFLRNNRHVELTAEGETLYRHVSAAFEQLQAGEEALLRGGGLDGGTSYEVELSAEDTVGNVRVVRYTAATSRVTLHLRAGGMGAAFGKYAEQEALECVWPAVFYGDVAVSGALTVNGQTVEAMLFPVGSVRLTDSPAAPETPAGAAWESVETGIAGVYGWRRTT